MYIVLTVDLEIIDEDENDYDYDSVLSDVTAMEPQIIDWTAVPEMSVSD